MFTRVRSLVMEKGGKDGQASTNHHTNRLAALQNPSLSSRESHKATARIRTSLLSLKRRFERRSSASWLPFASFRARCHADGEARRTHARLLTDLAANLPHVLGDRVQLQQVVLNLQLNGLDAKRTVVGRPRELTIRTEREETRSRPVAVRDSGSGIDSKLASRIFDAFYATKGTGMGIGLSISRSIVEQHGGRLWAEPNEGPGMTFQFTV
jgi:C4-dicarboxylate-specific signal transduction histidine kinase